MVGYKNSPGVFVTTENKARAESIIKNVEVDGGTLVR